MRISDWSSDVCSSDLLADDATDIGDPGIVARRPHRPVGFRIDRHATELDDVEGATVQANALLAVKYRPRRLDPDGQGGCSEQRPRHNDENDAEGHLEPALQALLQHAAAETPRTDEPARPQSIQEIGRPPGREEEWQYVVICGVA